MPLKTTSEDRKVLLLAAAVLIVMLVGVALIAPRQQDEISFPSSYSADSGGGKAAYLFLTESGYKVERWLHKPQDLPQGRGNVLILAQPFRPASHEDRLAVQRFIAHGGRVIAIGLFSAMLLPDEAAGFGAAPKACPT